MKGSRAGRWCRMPAKNEEAVSQRMGVELLIVDLPGVEHMTLCPSCSFIGVEEGEGAEGGAFATLYRATVRVHDTFMLLSFHASNTYTHKRESLKRHAAA